jgi:hypothetical protein
MPEPVTNCICERPRRESYPDFRCPACKGWRVYEDAQIGRLERVVRLAADYIEGQGGPGDEDRRRALRVALAELESQPGGFWRAMFRTADRTHCGCGAPAVLRLSHARGVRGYFCDPCADKEIAGEFEATGCELDVTRLDAGGGDAR